MNASRRPTREELAAAMRRRLPDVLGDDLDVLFCGINPSLYSAFTGHHFARPGNRFWPTLHRAGFTPRVLSPDEDRRLLDGPVRAGLTNLVGRATARADELSSAEIRRGAAALRRKVVRRRPRWVAVLGVGAYRLAFGRPDARVGRQAETLASAGLWVLPNPSGLNAHYQLPDLARLFAELRAAAARGGADDRGADDRRAD